VILSTITDWLSARECIITAHIRRVAKNKMAVQKLQKENIRFEKDNSTRKNSQKNLTG
jgi:hypothetical protein